MLLGSSVVKTVNLIRLFFTFIYVLLLKYDIINVIYLGI